MTDETAALDCTCLCHGQYQPFTAICAYCGHKMEATAKPLDEIAEMLDAARDYVGKQERGEIIGFTHRWHWFPDVLEDIGALLNTLAAAQREVAELRRLHAGDASGGLAVVNELTRKIRKERERAEVAEARVAALDAEIPCPTCGKTGEWYSPASFRVAVEGGIQVGRENAELKAAIVAATDDRDKWKRDYQWIHAERERIAGVLAEREAALAATKNALICYGAHEYSCAGLKPDARQYDDCSCGFAAALAGLPDVPPLDAPVRQQRPDAGGIADGSQARPQSPPVGKGRGE